MELDFKQTCPVINANLKSMSEWIEQYIGDLIDVNSIESQLIQIF